MIDVPGVETTLYVNPARLIDQETHDAAWSAVAAQLRAFCPGRRPRAELQYEVVMARGYYHSLPRILEGIDLDVHAPIQGRDIASSKEAYRRFSLREYEKVVELAGALGARALIIHLTPHDIPWEDGFAQAKRMEQLAVALASFRELVAYRERHAPELLLVPEGLEYPKWWADAAEAAVLLPSLKEIDSAVASCVDVAHLWHNRHLRPEIITAHDFADELAWHLETVDALAPVAKIHLAGAYIWHKGRGAAVHATHAAPGLAPWEELVGGTRLYLDGPPSGFRGEWLALGPVLKILAAFGKRRGHLPPLAMEVHGREMSEQMQIGALIQTILLRQMVG